MIDNYSDTYQERALSHQEWKDGKNEGLLNNAQLIAIAVAFILLVLSKIIIEIA